MKTFDYSTAVNQLKLGKDTKLNTAIRYDKIPYWVQGEDFLQLFLPYLKIIGDSREQDKWVEQACNSYGIAFEWAKTKDKGECLKEGDYSFKVIFGNKTYSYIGDVAYERKGSISEFYGNCTGNKTKNERERIEREFERFNEKQYRKVTLLLEFGDKLTDLINMQFDFYGKDGRLVSKSTGTTMYSTVMSWKQPNCKNFDILQSNSRKVLFWQMLQDCYYFFRNEIRNECIEKGIL